jgi:hypothetical protein
MKSKASALKQIMSKLEMMNRVHDILYLNNIINKKDIYL